MKRATAAAAALTCLVAFPASASATKYRAFAGTPGPPPESAPAGTELNRFFPSKMKVRQGDKVRYASTFFHNVSVLAEGEDPPALAQPDPSGATYAGINGPDNTPFHFNGLRKFVYDLFVFTKTGDNVVTKDEEGQSSGILLPSPPAEEGDPPRPGTTTVKFAAKGKVRILCTIHPGMVQDVTVLKKRARGADKPAKALARALKEARKGFKDAGKAEDAAEAVPAGTVYAGVERKQATLLRFLPGAATVPVGGSLTFRNVAPSEVHNMVFIGTRPGAEQKATAEEFAEQHTRSTDLLPTFGPNNQVMPDLVYASEPPTAPGAWTYSGDEFGQGYLQTPLMDALPGDPPAGLPSEETVVFTKPGTYHYYCAIHGKGMAGTVTVQ